jgi:hypothetical protein
MSIENVDLLQIIHENILKTSNFNSLEEYIKLKNITSQKFFSMLYFLIEENMSREFFEYYIINLLGQDDYYSRELLLFMTLLSKYNDSKDSTIKNIIRNKIVWLTPISLLKQYHPLDFSMVVSEFTGSDNKLFNDMVITLTISQRYE